MTGQVIPQTLGNTFVKKDLHPSWPTSAALASSSAVMASWRLTEGKSSRNFVQRVSCFEVVQESLKGDPRAPEYGCAVKDIRVLDDDITDRSHG